MNLPSFTQKLSFRIQLILAAFVIAMAAFHLLYWQPEMENRLRRSITNSVTRNVDTIANAAAPELYAGDLQSMNDVLTSFVEQYNQDRRINSTLKRVSSAILTQVTPESLTSKYLATPGTQSFASVNHLKIIPQKVQIFYMSRERLFLLVYLLELSKLHLILARRLPESILGYHGTRNCNWHLLLASPLRPLWYWIATYVG